MKPDDRGTQEWRQPTTRETLEAIEKNTREMATALKLLAERKE